MEKSHSNNPISHYVDMVLNSDEAYKEFLRVPIERQAMVFLDLPGDFQKKFGDDLSVNYILSLFKFLDPDEITDFLQHLPDEKHNQVAKKLDENLKEKVDYLLKFDPNSAAGLMNLDYVIVFKHSKVDTLYKKLQKTYQRKKTTPIVLVRDKENHLIGHIPFEHFILHRPHSLEKVIEDIPFVYYDEHYDDVIKKFNSTDHKNLVVVDYENHILGVIETNDLLKRIEESTTEDVYGLAGVNKEEDILDSGWSKFKSRYLWLILNLFTAFLAAGIVSLFEDTLTKLVLLAVYMPIIAGMGGNAATQTLAVVVRGISTHEIDAKTKLRVLGNELFAGTLNGLVNGIIVAIIAYFWNNMPMLGLVVGLSMVINLFIAGFFGTILPFILDRFKIDPAVAATVFVTTATDVVGFFVFLGLAEILLL